MPSIERAVTRLLNQARLYSIKSKIIAFALIATLLPSLGMGFLSYRYNRRVLQEKVREELANLTSHASRGLDLWFRERLYEVRVFSSSYEVSENLERIVEQGTTIENETPASRLATYLESVDQRFVVYDELLVVDRDGKIVASSASPPDLSGMPEDWRGTLSNATRVGEPYWDETRKAGLIMIAEPIHEVQHEGLLGLLIAKLNFNGVADILKSYSDGETDDLYVITEDGSVLTSSARDSVGFMDLRLESEVTGRLFARERLTLEFTDPRGAAVVGSLEVVERLGWGVVAQKERALAYAQIVQLRNVTLLLIAAVLVGIGLAAYFLGLTIVRPLDRLTSGAAKIAGGNLDVNLPISSRGELGYMTRVFNHMAKRLREVLGQLDRTNRTLVEKNEELHRLSITDGLTDLYNHKYIMETLVTESARCLRYNHPFSLLMIDIDDFKQYNDSHGHLAGDEVLRGVAAVLRESLRAGDYAARYGGEEFLILLPETGLEDADRSAERIRSRVEERSLGARGNAAGITVSVGVASFPENGSDPEDLISKADTAMYEAKRAGRNRVKLAGKKRKTQKRAAN